MTSDIPSLEEIDKIVPPWEQPYLVDAIERATEKYEHNLLRRQLERKFGTLSCDTAHALDLLSFQKVDELAMDFFIMKDIEELEGWLKKHSAE